MVMVMTIQVSYHARSLISAAVAMAFLSPGMLMAQPYIDVNGTSQWKDRLDDGAEMTRLAITGEAPPDYVKTLTVGADGLGTLQFNQNASGNTSLVEVWGVENEYIPSYPIGMAIQGGIHVNGVQLTDDASVIRVGSGVSDEKGIFSMSGPLTVSNSTLEGGLIHINSEGTFADITVSGSTINEYVFDLGSDATATVGNIRITDSTLGQKLISSDGDFTAGDIVLDNVTFTGTDALIQQYTGNNLSIGNLTITNTDLSNKQLFDAFGSNVTTGVITVRGETNKPVQFGESMIELNNVTKATLGGIVIEHAATAQDAVYQESIVNLNRMEKLEVPSITVNDVSIVNNKSSPYGLQTHTGGIRIEGSDDVVLGSLMATNIRHQGEDAFISLSGIHIQSTTVKDKIDALVAHQITTNTRKHFEGEDFTEPSEVYGIGLETATLNGVGRIDIRDISGTGSATTYGLNVSRTAVAADQLTVQGIQANDGKAYGARFNRTPATDKVESRIGQMVIGKVTSTNEAAHGLHVKGHTLQADSVVISEVVSKTHASGITALGGADITVKKGQIQMGSSTQTLSSPMEIRHTAIHADNSKVRIDGGTVQGNIVSTSEGLVSLSGDAETDRYVTDVFNVNKGRFEATLTNGSTLEGRVDDYWCLGTKRAEMLYDADGQKAIQATEGGQATLNLNGGAWRVADRSFVSNVAFGEAGGVVDLTLGGHTSLAIKNLKGIGTFEMTFGKNERDADGQIQSDMLYVQNMAADGRYTINPAIDSTVTSLDDLDGLRFATTNAVTTTDNFTVAFTDQGILDRAFTVKVEVYDPNDPNNEAFNGKGTGEGGVKPGNEAVNEIFKDGGSNWYLDTKKDAPTGPELSDAGQALLATAKGTYWSAVDMDRYHNRSADVRYAEGVDGVWLRMRHERLGTDSGASDFRSKHMMYQIGVDHVVSQADQELRLGLAVDYMDGESDYKGIAGEGGVDRYGLWAYGTMTYDSGLYLDLVAKYGRLKSDFDIVNGSGHRVAADYRNDMWALSIEGGRQFPITDTRLFVEPNAQLQYTRITSADYRTSQGSDIRQDAVDSLISRFGVRVGQMFEAKDRRAMVYAKADYFHEFMGDQTFRVKDATTASSGTALEHENDGHWFDVGFGCQAQFNRSGYGFVDAEYRFGNDLEKAWVFNAGIRFEF